MFPENERPKLACGINHHSCAFTGTKKYDDGVLFSFISGGRYDAIGRARINAFLSSSCRG